MRRFVGVTVWLALTTSTSAEVLSERQQSAWQQMDQAATANEIAAFVPAARKTLSRKLSDYTHTRFRKVTMRVVTPLDHRGHGFLLCGEILFASQDAQYRPGGPAKGWQPFVVDKGLVHEADSLHVTFASDGMENAGFVQDMCIHNAMGARPWRVRDPEFFAREISSR